jgi:hypothetical protein
MVGGEHAQSDPVCDKLEVSISNGLVIFYASVHSFPRSSYLLFLSSEVQNPASCRVVSLCNGAMAAVDAYLFALMTK